jgi:hypothetical protein
MNRRKTAQGRRGVVRAVWYGELLTTRGRMLRMRYAVRSTMKQHLAVSPTVSLTVRRNSLIAKKKRKTEMWRKTGMLSTVLRI